MRAPDDLGRHPPRRWSDVSYDFKLFGVYFIGTTVLLPVAGGAIPVETQLTVAVALATVLTALSIRNRRRSGWRWPGVDGRAVRSAVAGGAGYIVLLLAASGYGPPGPRVLPWYLAGSGMGLFYVFNALRVVRVSRIDFEAECRGVSIPSDTVATRPAEPALKRRVWLVWKALFVLLGLVWAASFYMDGVSMRNGSSVPTATHSVPHVEHGRTVYITKEQDRLLSLLQLIGMGGIPLVLLGGLALQKFLGVEIFQRRSE